jgi:ribosomal-protein-alanine N-acetyltransferase
MNKAIKLRPVEEADAEFLFEMMQDKDYQKYYLERLIPKNLNEAKSEVKKYMRDHNNKFAYYFIVEEGKTKIGFLDVYKIMQKDKRASIGYGVKKEYWGKGHGTKMCEMGLKFIKTKLKLHSVEATAEAENLASCKVLKNNGFERVGTIRDYYFDRGKFVSRVLYWKIL